MKKRKNWTEKERIISEVLYPLFLCGYSVTKACEHAGIPQRTVQSWIENDDALRLKIHSWQTEVSRVARKNIISKIKSKDPDRYQLSLFWLKYRERDDFGEEREIKQQALTYEDLLALQQKNILEARKILAEREANKKEGLYDLIMSKEKNPAVPQVAGEFVDRSSTKF